MLRKKKKVFFLIARKHHVWRRLAYYYYYYNYLLSSLTKTDCLLYSKLQCSVTHPTMHFLLGVLKEDTVRGRNGGLRTEDNGRREIINN